MSTITQVISTAPPAPSRQDPTTFADKSDAFVSYMESLDTELNTWAGQVNTVAGEVNTNAGIALQAVEDAEAQADLATINGAAQLSLTLEQVNIAQQAAQTSVVASNASIFNINTTYNISDVVYDSTDKYSAYISLQDNNIGHQPKTNISIWWERVTKQINVYDYENRSFLRTLSPQNNESVIIQGLGFFVFTSDSDEPDDDESCFATANGRWLLEAVHWDIVDAWLLPETEINTDFREKFLFGSAVCTISSVSTLSSASFSGTVNGAKVGDYVYVNPPAMLGQEQQSTSRLSFHAYISSDNTVTVILTNASAASATINSAVQTNWNVLVIQKLS